MRRSDTQLVPGDIVAYQHRGRWLTLWVVAIESDRKGAFPIVRLLGRPTKSPRRPSRIEGLQARDAMGMLFRLKERDTEKHRVIGHRLTSSIPSPALGAFCCASDELTLDRLVR